MRRLFVLCVVVLSTREAHAKGHSPEFFRWAAHFKDALASERVARVCGLRGKRVSTTPRQLELTRWPELNGTRIGVIPRQHFWMQNVETVEPLAMTAFIGAIRARQSVVGHATRSSWIVDIGANMGVYSLVGASIAPDFKTFAVDMQPDCARLTRCHLALNGLIDRAEVHNRYVTGSASAAPVEVPKDECNSMASPTAVGGRRPDGRLRAKSNALLQGRVNRSTLLPVPPLLLGALLRERLPTGGRVAVVKIDTEGYEPVILDALRPVWPLIDDLVVELQPHAWRLHGLDVEAAIATLRELVEAHHFRVVTLPHPRWKEMSRRSVAGSYDLVDCCKLPKRSAPVAGLGWLPHHLGMRKAEVYDAEGLTKMLRAVLTRPPGAFYEVLLTRRQCT